LGGDTGVYWERIEVLGPIHHLAGKGLNDQEIASEMNLPESEVQGCISWMLHSYKMSNRIRTDANDPLAVELLQVKAAE